MIKSFFKKIIPARFFSFYHWFLAYLAAFFYGYPSEKMIVIGVTGTAGKSTAVNLIGKILEQAGFKVGLSTTFNFKIGEQEWENKKKMTMLGRFALQKFLKKMFQSGCHYAIIETSSEGIKQFRHLGINYDIVVFLNLLPEHLESHGGFEKYRQAKEKLFFQLTKKTRKIINGKLIEKISIVNFDDQHKEYFLKYSADQKYGFTIINQTKTRHILKLKESILC
jgi:UDP-N-acetylmuramoyl-L-alanyl-D-glutamate--2,6-diaminopimelate ligase